MTIDTNTDQALLAAVTGATAAAAERLLAVFAPDARPASRADMAVGGHRIEDIVVRELRGALTALRPGARWLDEEQETTALPNGEWWVVDAVEGGVNFVHGLPEFAVTVTLVRDQAPVLTVVRQPVGDLTYTAILGGGAYRNGQSLTVGAKTELNAAITVTGQAEAGQDGTYRRIGESVTAMLGEALLVRMFVPSTFPLLALAAGQHDVFWQYEPVLPGVAAGMLLVSEAGGVASRIDGAPWRPGASDILVTTPALHAAAVAVLSKVS